MPTLISAAAELYSWGDTVVLTGVQEIIRDTKEKTTVELVVSAGDLRPIFRILRERGWKVFSLRPLDERMGFTISAHREN